MKVVVSEIIQIIVVLVQPLKNFLNELKHRSLLNPAGLKKVNFIEINSSI